MEFGISTFGEAVPDNTAGNAVNAHKLAQELIEEGKLADSIGLDVYALGEHHRPDYMISSPEVMLAAVAAVTKNIKLTSAVTVLSSADPVRTFQNFATLDLISGGRAEIMAGRGSFIESFPLFGYDLNDYDALFTEKLDMLMKINEQEKLTWSGKFRAPISNKGIYPRPYKGKLPIWIAVGGTPASVVRAGKLNLPLTIAILGGDPDQFVPLVNLYRRSAQEAGHDVNALQLCINQHMYIAEDDQQASDEFWPVYSGVMNRIGKERGWSPMSREHFEMMREHSGSLLVGSPERVIEKLVYGYSIFKNTRFLAQTISGNIDPAKLLRSIKLFGTKVVPEVRKRIGQ